MTRSTHVLSLMAAAALIAAFPGRASWAQGNAGWVETGEASWYGERHAGLRTSSGEVFDPAAMTAAHSTLPLGSRVRVTLDGTARSVVVRVTDRLPPHGLRVIDLSRGAASRLGIVNRGTAMVTLIPAQPGEVEEVAEAPGDDGDAPALTLRPHGRRHMRHVRR